MNTPFFSIIVPTFDRPQALMACVQALKQLDYPRDRFEVIIVDDGSPIPVQMGDPYPESTPMITILRQGNAGPAAARNLGSRQARGDVLAFTDDDCIPDSQWLTELAKACRDAPTGLVGGQTVNGLVENRYSIVSQVIVDEAYAFFFSRDSDLRFFSSNNIAVSAQLFHESGAFDSSFRTSEDRDFCDRWIRQGHPLVYAPNAMVHHHHHLTMRTFFRQHCNYGRGAYRFHRARVQRSGSRLRPDVQFYASVFRRLLCKPLSWNSLSMAGLMVLWQVANLTGFLWQAAHSHLVLTRSPPSERFGVTEGTLEKYRDR